MNEITTKLLPFHPLAVKYGGNLNKQQLEALAKDIAAKGQHHPIIVHEGKVIEGIQRYRACLRAKVDPETVPYDVKKYGGTEADIKAFIISENVYRRHDAKRRNAIIAELLKEDPTKSDRAIAKEAKTHHHAVAKVRQEEEKRGNLSHVEKRTDTKGRQQPAEKPRKLVPPKPTLAVALRTRPEPAPLVEQKPLSGDAWWDQEPQTIADVMVKRMTGQKITKVFALAMDGLKTKQATASRPLRMTDSSTAATIIEAPAKQPDDGLDIPDYPRREPKGDATS